MAMVETTTNTETNTSQLAALIEAKLQLLEVLARLGKRQLELIEAGNMADLIKLLAAKQTVIQQLQRVERQLDPYRDENPDQRVWPSAAARANCQARAERCNAALAHTLNLEKQAESAMNVRREQAAESVAAAQSAADVRSAYGSLAGSFSTGLHVEG
jgi:hypothetical protein